MSESGQLKNTIIYKWLLGIAVFLIVVAVVFAGIEIYDYSFHGRVYPGVILGDWPVGGKSREQLSILLQAKMDQLTNEGISVKYQDKIEVIYPIDYAAIENGAAYELWSYDLEKTADKIYQTGRSKHGWAGWRERVGALFGRIKLGAEYYWNKEGLRDVLTNKFKEYEDPGQEARLVWENNEPIASQEKAGQIFDYQVAIEKWQNNLERIDNQAIELVLVAYQPTITKEAVQSLLEKAREATDLAPITLEYASSTGAEAAAEKKWLIKKDEWRDWLMVKDNGQGEVYLGLDESQVGQKISEIAEKIDQPVKDARFTVENGRVKEFQSAQDGRVVDARETIKNIEQVVLREGISRASLIMKTEKTELTNESVNDLGIKELVGHGESSFAGSPKNRIHNIGVGAAALNGLLIKPGEEFSINKALGTVDGSTGYKQEMVIKGDKTIPEYGGGLCQVGTTLFRLAINAGLPITERRNHSYRVGYYEPAGTDATIYGPWPDLKFINDTGNYLLLQTRVEGTKAYFDFWGTKDGREVATTTPVIYNIVKPAETKIVETDTLKPGEKKCTERAHNGADAYFKRAILWPAETGKEKIEETFRSHYVPWQEVCLVGKELSATATSTTEVISN